MTNYPKFGDFAEEDGPLDGAKKSLDEILNTEILLLGFKIGRSKYKDRNYLTLQFEIPRQDTILPQDKEN